MLASGSAKTGKDMVARIMPPGSSDFMNGSNHIFISNFYITMCDLLHGLFHTG